MKRSSDCGSRYESVGDDALVVAILRPNERYPVRFSHPWRRAFALRASQP